MDLVKDALQIQFTDPPRPWAELRGLLRAATGEPTAEMQAAPLVIDRPNDKTRIVLQVRAVLVDRESASLPDEAVKTTQSQVLHLHEASPFPRVSSMRYEMVFIEPFDVPFHELVGRMKSSFLAASRTANECTDIGVVFDQRDGQLLKRVQIGPMDKTQLTSEVLKWPRDDLPQTFAFVRLAYEDSQEVDFSEDILNSFFAQAASWQKSEVELLAHELKEAGN